MATFAISCPSCGSYAEAKKGFLGTGTKGTGLLGTGLFSKEIICSCNHKINIETDKINSTNCPHCKNDVVYDQSKGDAALCPVCKGTINTVADVAKTAQISCPKCSCNIQVNKNSTSYDCPICGEQNIDVQQRIGLANIAVSGIASVIKYEGDNETFIWKHPIENFNFGSQLIVHESQEAVFFMNGQALDLFAAGRHTLETQNMPLVGDLLGEATGGVTPFHCEVYFINKTEQLAIKWGTDTKLEYVEPAYGFPIQIGASGEMALRVEDSRKLLVKIVGTEGGITQQGFVQKMRAFLMIRIKNYLASYIKRERINIFEIDEHLLNISEALHEQFKPDFLDYGISMERFFVATILKPEDDHNYRRFKELHFRQYADVAEARLAQQTGLIDQETQKQRMILEAEGLAQKRALEGYTYQDERGFDVAERVAANEAVGQMSNLGVGLGTMVGVGGAVGGAVGGMMQNTMGALNSGGVIPQNQTEPPKEPKEASATAPCTKCNAPLPTNAKFCLECGQPALSENEVICPSCGIKTIKGKFCLDCGASMIKKCSGCNTEIPAGGKFCLECGQKV
ncbi:MAG: SPFH domain-containing protein [Defluviitaleaceae bacterium]|nr:SPFH domain-containing protein [Defluviitaleaceae bacterium]